MLYRRKLFRLSTSTSRDLNAIASLDSRGRHDVCTSHSGVLSTLRRLTSGGRQKETDKSTRAMYPRDLPTNRGRGFFRVKKPVAFAPRHVHRLLIDMNRV